MYAKNREASALAAISRGIAEQQRAAKNNEDNKKGPTENDSLRQEDVNRERSKQFFDGGGDGDRGRVQSPSPPPKQHPHTHKNDRHSKAKKDKKHKEKRKSKEEAVEHEMTVDVDTEEHNYPVDTSTEIAIKLKHNDKNFTHPSIDREFRDLYLSNMAESFEADMEALNQGDAPVKLKILVQALESSLSLFSDSEKRVAVGCTP